MALMKILGLILAGILFSVLFLLARQEKAMTEPSGPGQK